MSYTWFGLLYEERGKFDLARENYKKALELEPQSGWTEHKLIEMERFKQEVLQNRELKVTIINEKIFKDSPKEYLAP